jgi:hypothetical protein
MVKSFSPPLLPDPAEPHSNLLLKQLISSKIGPSLFRLLLQEIFRPPEAGN